MAAAAGTAVVAPPPAAMLVDGVDESGRAGDARAAAASVHVLVADSDSSSRGVLCSLLRNCHYKVTAVKNAQQVMEQLANAEVKFDLILTEVDGKDGLRLLRHVTSSSALRRIPVVMMSKSNETELVVKCLKSGAADYLVKPLRKNELRNLWIHVWRRRSKDSGSGVQPKPRAKEGSSELLNASATHASPSTIEPSDCSSVEEGSLGSGQLLQRGSPCKRPALEHKRKRSMPAEAAAGAAPAAAVSPQHPSLDLSLALNSSYSNQKIPPTSQAGASLRVQDAQAGSPSAALNLQRPPKQQCLGSPQPAQTLKMPQTPHAPVDMPDARQGEAADLQHPEAREPVKPQMATQKTSSKGNSRGSNAQLPQSCTSKMKGTSKQASKEAVHAGKGAQTSMLGKPQPASKTASKVPPSSVELQSRPPASKQTGLTSTGTAARGVTGSASLRAAAKAHGGKCHAQSQLTNRSCVSAAGSVGTAVASDAALPGLPKSVDRSRASHDAQSQLTPEGRVPSAVRANSLPTSHARTLDASALSMERLHKIAMDSRLQPGFAMPATPSTSKGYGGRWEGDSYGYGQWDAAQSAMRPAPPTAQVTQLPAPVHPNWQPPPASNPPMYAEDDHSHIWSSALPPDYMYHYDSQHASMYGMGPPGPPVAPSMVMQGPTEGMDMEMYNYAMAQRHADAVSAMRQTGMYVPPYGPSTPQLHQSHPSMVPPTYHPGSGYPYPMYPYPSPYHYSYAPGSELQQERPVNSVSAVQPQHVSTGPQAQPVQDGLYHRNTPLPPQARSGDTLRMQVPSKSQSSAIPLDDGAQAAAQAAFQQQQQQQQQVLFQQQQQLQQQQLQQQQQMQQQQQQQMQQLQLQQQQQLQQQHFQHQQFQHHFQQQNPQDQQPVRPFSSALDVKAAVVPASGNDRPRASSATNTVPQERALPTLTATSQGAELQPPVAINPVHRAERREAALSRFRLKKKDRCFTKKIRYATRKKLAEARPRVKGQFVRTTEGETSAAAEDSDAAEDDASEDDDQSDDE